MERELTKVYLIRNYSNGDSIMEEIPIEKISIIDTILGATQKEASSAKPSSQISKPSSQVSNKMNQILLVLKEMLRIIRDDLKLESFEEVGEAEQKAVFNKAVKTVADSLSINVTSVNDKLCRQLSLNADGVRRLIFNGFKQGNVEDNELKQYLKKNVSKRNFLEDTEEIDAFFLKHF